MLKISNNKDYSNKDYSNDCSTLSAVPFMVNLMWTE